MYAIIFPWFVSFHFVYVLHPHNYHTVKIRLKDWNGGIEDVYSINFLSSFFLYVLDHYYYFFFIFSIYQVLSVLIATAGAIMSIKNFENSFNNYHQRIGLALYGAIWVQALIGFCRPGRRSKGRSVWYFVHWILGTTVSVVGMINIYTGLEAYQKKTSRSIRLWTVLFTAEVCLMAFFYLFQDKWEYMQKQGVIMGNEAVTPSDQVIPTQRENSLKEILTEPCRKKNALMNHFMN